MHNSGKVTVEEVAPLSPTTPSPPAVNRRQTQGEQQSPPSQEPDERETACAMALRAELEVNARMRAGCTNRASFKRQYWLWQQRENVARRTRRVSASAALKILPQLNGTPPSQPGRRWVIVNSSGKVTIVDKMAAPPGGSRAKDSREEVEASKHGVDVSQFNFDGIVATQSTAVVRGVITNHDPTPCVLRSVHLDKMSHSCFAVTSFPSHQLPATLGSDGSCGLAVSCRPTADGVCHALLWFTFNKGAVSFRIGRVLEARCGNELILDMLKPTAPYVRAKPKGPPLSAHEVHAAVKATPNQSTSNALHHSLKPYPLNMFPFWNLLRAGGPDVAEELERGHELMCFLRDGPRLGLAPGDAAAMAEYAAHQQRLLVAEEMELVHGLHMYDMVGENATVLTRKGKLLWLNVAGLAEKRPSVLLGDRVLLRLADGSQIKQRLRYEGVAECIEMNEVGLKIKNDFVDSYLPGQRVEVRGCARFPSDSRPHSLECPQQRHKTPKASAPALHPHIGLNIRTQCHHKLPAQRARRGARMRLHPRAAAQPGVVLLTFIAPRSEASAVTFSSPSADGLPQALLCARRS